MTDKKDERKNVLGGRLNERGGSKASKTDKTSKEESSSKNSKTNVRDKKGVTMYLDEELVEELDMRFQELKLEFRREHGVTLEKNADFYRAMVREAITGEAVEDELWHMVKDRE